MYYHVSVYDHRTNRRIDKYEVAVGKWQDIGFWLSDHGYIEPEFYVKVLFIEEGQ